MTSVFNTRLVFRTQGALLLLETIFMSMAALVSWFYDEPDLGALVVSTIVTATVGLLGLFIGRKAEKRVGEREGYVIVASVWVVFSIFGLLPYYLTGAIETVTDAWFETMSGFTTTGATILTDIESLSHGLLFWRSLTQWLGGLGIIVLAVAILPMFGLSGMQLYAAEVTGLTYEKLSPRIADTAKHLWLTYLILTATETLLLRVEGMGLFDSLCHSLTTIATGGFSTHDASIAYFNSPLIEYTVAFFMLLSGINFAMLILFFRGKPSRLFHDEETRWYITAALLATLILTIGRCIEQGGQVEQAFRHAFFTTVATMTSTGFAITDYMQWAPFLWVLVFFLMFTGASSGSTSGGIKWIRLAIYTKSGLAEMKHRIHPNAIVPIKINNKPINQQTTNNVMAFMLFYLIILVVSTLLFCACGVNFDESLGATVSALGNVGPSIGQYGPCGTYTDFPMLGKWAMTIVMLIGRLEIFTILLLFSQVLWKK